MSGYNNKAKMLKLVLLQVAIVYMILPGSLGQVGSRKRNNGTGITTEKMSTKGGSRGMAMSSDGGTIVTITLDDGTEKNISVSLRRVVELDAQRNEITCGGGKYDFDENNPANSGVQRQAKENEAKSKTNVNPLSKMTGSASASEMADKGIRKSKDLSGSAETVQYMDGDLTADLQSILSESAEDIEVTVGDSKVIVSEGDVKFVPLLSGHKWCGSPNKTCKCPGPGKPNLVGKYLRMYMQLQIIGGPGSGSSSAPTKNTQSGKPNTQNVNSFKPAGDGYELVMMDTAVCVTAGGIINTKVVQSGSETLQEHGNRMVPVIYVDFEKCDDNSDTSYSIDPVGSTAPFTCFSTLLLFISAVIKGIF